jgi:outer membrane protein assembly factor BamB
LALARLKRHDCLVSLSNRPVSVVRVWDPQSGEQRCEFPLREAGNELGVIDSDLLLEAEGRLERWQLDPATGERRVVWSQTESSRLVALHSDGQTVLGEQDQHLLAIDVETGRLRRRWTDQRTGRIQTGEFHELLVSADGHWLLTSSNEGLRLWDLLSWKMVGYINNPANCRVSAAFHPSRSELVLTRDGRVEVWQLVPSAISSVADIQSTAVVDFGLSADGSLLAQLLGDSGGEMAMVIGSLKTPELPPSRLALEWHTVPLVVVDATGRRVLSSLGGGEPSVGLIATGTGEPPQRLVSNAMLARFDPDGRRLWYCGSKKSDRQKPPSASADDVGFLAAYDLETGRETFRWLNETSQQRDSVSGLLALAVGRRVVAVSSVDQRMRLFDSATGELRWESPILGGLGDCVALDEEQGLVYCGTRHGELQGLDLATGDTRWRVPGHIEGVMSLDVAAGLVVSGGRSGQVVAWDLRGEVPVPLWTLGPFDGSVIRCQLTNDASRLAVLIEREHGVRIYDLEHLRLQFGHLRLDP